MNAPRTRVQRRPVHGVLLLDKPLGFSSNDALQKVKWLLRAEKAGHTGVEQDTLCRGGFTCVNVRRDTDIAVALDGGLASHG